MQPTLTIWQSYSYYSYSSCFEVLPFSAVSDKLIRDYSSSAELPVQVICMTRCAVSRGRFARIMSIHTVYSCHEYILNNLRFFKFLRTGTKFQVHKLHNKLSFSPAYFDYFVICYESYKSLCSHELCIRFVRFCFALYGIVLYSTVLVKMFIV